MPPRCPVAMRIARGRPGERSTNTGTATAMATAAAAAANSAMRRFVPLSVLALTLLSRASCLEGRVS